MATPGDNRAGAGTGGGAPGPPPGGSLMIGPSGAGKTSILATLELSSRLFSSEELGQFDVFPKNPQAERLFDDARQIGLHGRLTHPGTAEARTYEIELKHRRPARWWNAVWQTDGDRYPLRVVDGAGGDVFQVLDDEDLEMDRRDRAGEYAERGAGSQGLIICVDANDRSTTSLFFFNLNAFLRKVAARHRGEVPFRRVAIALTKADTLVGANGPHALGNLERRDPCAHARDLIGTVGLSDLFIHLKPSARPIVACGFVSVYGFIPQDGAANFLPDEDGGRMATFTQGDASWINHWRPYRVLDPFVFAATGHLMSMRPISRPRVGS